MHYGLDQIRGTSSKPSWCSSFHDFFSQNLIGIYRKLFIHHPSEVLYRFKCARKLARPAISSMRMFPQNAAQYRPEEMCDAGKEV